MDLEASEDDFTSDTTSSSEEETFAGDGSKDSMEIMGITLGNPKEGLQDNPSTPYREPLVEESKLQQMLSIDLSLDEREEYLCMLRKHSSWMALTRYKECQWWTALSSKSGATQFLKSCGA